MNVCVWVGNLRFLVGAAASAVSPLMRRSKAGLLILFYKKNVKTQKFLAIQACSNACLSCAIDIRVAAARATVPAS